MYDVAAEAVEFLKAADSWTQHRVRTIFEANLRSLTPPKAPPANGVFVQLVTTCMGRWWQVRRALPINLLQLWPYAGQVCVYLVAFFRPGHYGEDEENLRWLWEVCRPAIDIGLLVIGKVTALTHWHCWIAKNTAFRFASEKAPPTIRRHQLVGMNLDGDNVLGEAFMHEVIRRYNERPPPRMSLVHYRTHQGGTCGRMSWWSNTFKDMGGFYEGFLPMGFGEIDLMRRIQHRGTKELLLARAQVIQVVENPFVVGLAIPNSFDSASAATQQKVALVAPEYAGMKWGNMNQQNNAIGAERMERGLLVANEGKQFHELGAPQNNWVCEGS